jgi:hypothetical protein
MEKSYVLGFCKDDVYYDDFGQPWVDYSDMHEYSGMHEYAYTSYACAGNLATSSLKTNLQTKP